MLNRALRLSACTLILSALFSAVVVVAAESSASPSIAQMEAMASGDPSAVSDEAKKAVKEADDLLQKGNAREGKARLIRYRMFYTATEAERKLMAPVEKKIDQALGSERVKIENEIKARLEKELENQRKYSEVLKEFIEKQKVLEEQNRREAVAFADQAAEELYTMRNPARAEELARKALALDPKNEKAQKTYAEALAQQGKTVGTEQVQISNLAQLPTALLQAQMQEFANVKDKARKLYAEGKFKESVEEWRRAETYVGVLSVHMDVQKGAEEVQNGLKSAEEAYDKAQRELTQREKDEAEKKIEQEVVRIEQQEAEKVAEELQMVYKLIREKKFDDAEKMIKDIKYRDPANKGAEILDDICSRERHDFEMNEIAVLDEKQLLRTAEKVYEQAIPYRELMDYPRKAVWEDAIKPRPGVPYPSKVKEYTVRERAVMKNLDQKVTLRFDETPLRDVITFLQEVTPVNFAVVTADIPPDGGLVTLHIETELRDALDQICNLVGLAWKVEGAVVKIAKPETLKEYELRVYDIRDLLINTEDKRARRTMTLTETGTNETSSGTSSSDSSSGFDFGTDTSGTGTTGESDVGGSPSEMLIQRADALRQLIQQTVSPTTWEAGGRIGGVNPLTDTGTGTGGEAASPWDTAAGAGGGGFGGGMAGGLGAGAGAAQGAKGRAFFRGGNPGDLIIIQTAEVHAEIEDLLRELRKAMYIQVNVEARFIEVSVEAFKEVGFDFSKIDLNAKSTDPTDNDITLRTGIPMFADSSTWGMNVNFSIFGGTHAEGVFRLLQSRSETRTLATPIITLMNGQRGYLTVETSQNYVGSFETSEGAFEPQIDTISDSVTLDVRPIVSADRRYVFLELVPTVSQVLGFDSFTWTAAVSGGTDASGGAGAAVTATNQVMLPRQLVETLETTVCVPDRGILMVGGLTRQEKQDYERGIPILNKIPIIKRIFMAEGAHTERRTLVVLVRPQIIISDEEERRAF